MLFSLVGRAFFLYIHRWKSCPKNQKLQKVYNVYTFWAKICKITKLIPR